MVLRACSEIFGQSPFGIAVDCASQVGILAKKSLPVDSLLLHRSALDSTASVSEMCTGFVQLLHHYGPLWRPS